MVKNPRCLYHSDFLSFLSQSTDSVFGMLCDSYHGDALTTTREAWKSEIEVMKGVLSALPDKTGQIIFEYDIPRLGKRIDVVLLYRGIVFCLEFKVEESKILEADVDQVLDYALDLKNFHKFSQEKVIVPILVATKFSEHTTSVQMSVYDDRVVNPLVTGERGLFDVIAQVLNIFPNETVVNKDWIISPYAPTPTIVEAAKTLYENHSVENITRHEADKVSTDQTISYILDVIHKSKLNREKSICFADYLKRGGTYGNKLKVPNFPMSEAAFLIWSLDQREDWATIICLVGGGQEINTGEAGISEWIYALNEKFPHWKVYISPKLTEPEYAEGKVNELLAENKSVTYSESLHLGVSLRSYRAEKLSAFVHALLAIEPNAAELYREIRDRYPIVLTRDMKKAREWLHSKVRGTERTGILLTKESARFKPLAIHVLPSGDENAVHWFLEDKIDTRSSNYLEDAATEIQVQGLELDYTCLLWDADMRYENGKWRFYRFNGQTKWVEQTSSSESKQELMKYMLNAYRVLLTRARSGMVICVPSGNPNKNPSGFWEDSTRLPEFYDGTYEYLKKIGIIEL